MGKSCGASSLVVALALAVVALALGSAFVLVATSPPSATAGGTVKGVVSVGPSQPVCRMGESCTVDMSGYSLIFSERCYSLCPALSRAAPLADDGSYSVALPAGTYTVNLSSCQWIGCSSALPTTVSVNAGQTAVLNVTVDTGIR